MRLFLERRTTDKENQTLTPDNKKATDYLLNESRQLHDWWEYVFHCKSFYFAQNDFISVQLFQFSFRTSTNFCSLTPCLNNVTTLSDLITKECKITWFLKTNHKCSVESEVLLSHKHFSENCCCLKHGRQKGAAIYFNSKLILRNMKGPENQSFMLMLPSKGHKANPTKLFQAVRYENVRKLQALTIRAKRNASATFREAQIAVSEVLGRLRFDTSVAAARRERQAAILKTDGIATRW